MLLQVEGAKAECEEAEGASIRAFEDASVAAWEDAEAEGELGGADPLEAIGKVVTSRQFDEILLSTLPNTISKWLRRDLPHQVQRRFGLPVTTITARR